MNKISVFFLLLALLHQIGLNAEDPSFVDTERQLRASAGHMNKWLGVDNKARRWRQILNLNVLDAQAALGHRADPNALREIQSRFNSEIDGLDHPMFQSVNFAIGQHLIQLDKNQQDILTLVSASEKFQPPTLNQLEGLRQNALYDADLLIAHYRKKYTSRERAELFYDLKIDDLVSFLQNSTFELPPLRSTEEIKIEVDQVESKIKLLSKQIDSLNQQLTRIQDWIEKPDPPADQEPPMPDDEDDDSGEESELELSAPHNDSDVGSDPTTEIPKVRRQEKLEQLKSGVMDLNQEKMDLETKKKRLQQEIKVLQQSERKRIRRYQLFAGELNRFQKIFYDQSHSDRDGYLYSVVDSLDQLRTTYRYLADPRTKRQFPTRLKQLSASYKQLRETDDRRATAKLGNLSGWMESAGQSRDLVSAIRAQFSKPNFYLEVSDRLANIFASRPVKQTEKVDDQILNRLIKGVAYLNGNVTVEFVPHPYQVHAVIDLSGQIDSDTYTRSGKFTGYAGAIGTFNFRRDLFANFGGLFACEAYGDVQLGSYFKCIDSSCGLVQKIAVKQYKKSKERSEQISTELTKKRILEEFNNETDKSILPGYVAGPQILDAQIANGKFLPAVYLHSENDRVVIVGHKSTPFDLAAPTNPQDFPWIHCDVRTKIHESMISNYISPLLAGKRFSNSQIAEEFEEILQRPLSDNEDGESFTVLFDESRPIQIEFGENQFGVSIFGKEFSRDGKRIKDGLKIQLKFKLVEADGAIQIAPSGEVNVELIDPNRKNIQTVTFKNFLQQRLSDALSESDENTFELPENLIPTEMMKPEFADMADKFRIAQLRFENGWAYIGWNFAEDTNFASLVLDTPAIWPDAKVAPESPNGDPQEIKKTLQNNVGSADDMTN